MSENTGILLETKDLSKYFTAKKGLLNRNPSVVKAVDHVSLSVRKGETLGLVGESGCCLLYTSLGELAEILFQTGSRKMR